MSCTANKLLGFLVAFSHHFKMSVSELASDLIDSRQSVSSVSCCQACCWLMCAPVKQVAAVACGYRRLQISTRHQIARPAGCTKTLWCRVVIHTVCMSKWKRNFRTDKFNGRDKRKFFWCNWSNRLGTSRLHELHESKHFRLVSRIEFIRSKLSNFYLLMWSGVTVVAVAPDWLPTAERTPHWRGKARPGLSNDPRPLLLQSLERLLLLHRL